MLQVIPRAAENESISGEFCCLLGTSGSGKSTLLNVMAGIEKLTSGEIIIRNRKINKMHERKGKKDP